MAEFYKNENRLLKKVEMLSTNKKSEFYKQPPKGSAEAATARIHRFNKFKAATSSW